MTTTQREQINSTIHRWLGKCVHNWQQADTSPQFHCEDCGLQSGMRLYDVPDYCSESSPRSLLGEAEKKLLANDPSCEIAGRYVTLLCQEVGIDTQRWERKGPDGWLTILITTVDGFCLTNATAEQRATAIFNLIEEGKDERTESQTA